MSASRNRPGARMSATEKLLRHSQKYLSADGSQNGEIIAKEADFDFVSRVLANLSPLLIPLGAGGHELEQRRDAAMRAVIDLSSINMSLHRVRNSPTVQAYEKQYFPAIIEHWPGIIQWLEFLLIHTQVTTPGGTESMAHLCCDLLDTIVASSTDNSYKEEIATRQCTVDLIYMLLRQRERQSPHQYYYIPPLQAKPGEGRCKIVKLFQTALSTQAGWKAMEERLASVNRRTRDSIVRSLVTRAEEIVLRNPSFTIGVMDTLHSLVWAVSRITANGCIWNAFKRARFLGKYAHVLSILAEKADRGNVTDQKSWASIAKSAAMFSFCAENVPALTELMEEGHYITCVVLCFRHQVSPLDLLKGLDNVLPYLYLSKVYRAANTQDSIRSLLEPRRYSIEKENRIYREYARFLSHVQITHAQGSKLSVNLCSNMKHWWSKGTFQTGEGDAVEKTCSRCHSVVYCSAECQKADWGVHLRECSILSKTRYALKSKGVWVPLAARKEQLKLLQTVANREVPSPAELQKRDLLFITFDEPTPPLHCTLPPSRYGSSASTFEFFTRRPDEIVHHERLDMQSYLKTICKYPEMVVWIPRIQRWIADMEASPGARAFVEGAFRLHHGYSMLVLTRLSYSHKAQKGERYAILNSIFCPVPTLQLPNVTET